MKATVGEDLAPTAKASNDTKARSGKRGNGDRTIAGWSGPQTLPTPCLVPKFKVPNFFFRHLHGDLNLDKIKNALHSLSVNRETNLMNLIRP